MGRLRQIRGQKSHVVHGIRIKLYTGARSVLTNPAPLLCARQQLDTFEKLLNCGFGL